MDSSANASSPATRQRGFTLLELLVTLTIAGIVAAVGMPAMGQLLEDSKVSSRSDLLAKGLLLAHDEAISRNARVSVCRSTDGAACAVAGDWSAGWIVFVDGATAGTIDTADTILVVQSALPAGGAITETGLGAYVSYVSNGQARNGENVSYDGSFKVCARSAKVRMRTLTLVPGSSAINVKSETAAGCA